MGPTIQFYVVAFRLPSTRWTQGLDGWRGINCRWSHVQLPSCCILHQLLTRHPRHSGTPLKLSRTVSYINTTHLTTTSLVFWRYHLRYHPLDLRRVSCWSFMGHSISHHCVWGNYKYLWFMICSTFFCYRMNNQTFLLKRCISIMGVSTQWNNTMLVWRRG